MTDKVQPFTREERISRKLWGTAVLGNGADCRHPAYWEIKASQRYEAAIAAVEAERDALWHESDKLKVELSEAQEKRDELQDEAWDLLGELENMEEA